MGRVGQRAGQRAQRPRRTRDSGDPHIGECGDHSRTPPLVDWTRGTLVVAAAPLRGALRGALGALRTLVPPLRCAHAWLPACVPWMDGVRHAGDAEADHPVAHPRSLSSASILAPHPRSLASIHLRPARSREGTVPRSSTRRPSHLSCRARRAPSSSPICGISPCLDLCDALHSHACPLESHSLRVACALAHPLRPHARCLNALPCLNVPPALPVCVNALISLPRPLARAILPSLPSSRSALSALRSALALPSTRSSALALPAALSLPAS